VPAGSVGSGNFQNFVRGDVSILTHLDMSCCIIETNLAVLTYVANYYGVRGFRTVSSKYQSILMKVIGSNIAHVAYEVIVIVISSVVASNMKDVQPGKFATRVAKV